MRNYLFKENAGNDVFAGHAKIYIFYLNFSIPAYLMGGRWCSVEWNTLKSKKFLVKKPLQVTNFCDIFEIAKSNQKNSFQF